MLRTFPSGLLVFTFLSAAVMAGEAQSPPPPDAPTSADEVTSLVQQRKFPEAKRRLGELLEADPNNSQLLFKRGAIEWILGEIDQATADLTKAIDLAPENPRAYVVRAACYESRGDSSAALRDLNTAIQRDANCADAYYRRGCLEEQRGRVEEALVDFDKVLEIVPDAGAQHMRGTCLVALGRWEEALKAFDQSLALNPREIKSYVTRAIVYWRLGKAQDAIADCNRVIDRDADFGTAYLIRALVYAGQGYWEQAVRDLGQAAKLEAEASSTAYYYRGLIYLRFGHYPEAVADFERALQSGPTTLEVLLARAAAYRALEKPDLANADIRAAMKNQKFGKLHKACRAGDLAEVQQLLAQGQDVNEAGPLEMTPLHLACLGDHLQVLRLLLHQGANPNARDATGQTPLHHACRYGSMGAVVLLLANRADPNCRQGSLFPLPDSANAGDQPLHIACRAGKWEIIAFLLEHGADRQARSESGQTILELLRQGGSLPQWFTEGDLDLVFAGDDSNRSRVKALVNHCALGCSERLTFLRAQVPDLNVRDDRGMTPLGQACASGCFDVAMFLVQEGADVNCADADGRTPLHHATESENLAIAQLLLNHGADATRKSQAGETPLDVLRRTRLAKGLPADLTYPDAVRQHLASATERLLTDAASLLEEGKQVVQQWQESYDGALVRAAARTVPVYMDKYGTEHPKPADPLDPEERELYTYRRDPAQAMHAKAMAYYGPPQPVALSESLAKAQLAICFAGLIYDEKDPRHQQVYTRASAIAAAIPKS
jgi:ankyrin repeat protein/Tfp pilus assembly protein PilF